MFIQGAFSLGGSSGGGGIPDSLTLEEKSSLPRLDLERLQINDKKGDNVTVLTL